MPLLAFRPTALTLGLILLSAGLSTCAQRAPITPQALAVMVLARTPHDTGAFTEGLAFLNGQLYESVGLNGQSELRQVQLSSGAVLRRMPIASQYFGEGLTGLGGKLYQLTWEDQLGFVYDAQSLQKTGTFQYPTEGWGLTNDGKRLIMSDGSSRLSFIDPATLKITGGVSVNDRGAPLHHINELEWVNGVVYANVWHSSWIARIDPASGAVTGWIDARPLAQAAAQAGVTDSEAVLNGIAYNPANGNLYLTGKLWPSLFQVKLVAGNALPPVGGGSTLGN